MDRASIVRRDMQIKILVTIVLVCGAFASGYFVGRYVVEREASVSITLQRDANREKFAKELIQFRAKTMSNLTSEEMYQITRQFRVASDTYFLNARHLKAMGPALEIEDKCLTDASYLMDSLAVFMELCLNNQPECTSETNKAMTTTFQRVNVKLSECLGMFLR